MNYEEIGEWEMNHAIAKVLGLKLVKLDEPEILDWFEPTLGKQVHIEKWFYYDLLGENISGAWDTEDNAWEHADYPDYSHDLNEAITLQSFGLMLSIHQGRRESEKWIAQYMTEQMVQAARGWAETPALAICRARLALARYKPE